MMDHRESRDWLRVLLGSCWLMVLGCDSGTGLQQSFADGYWITTDGVVVKTEGDAMNVVDFGGSQMASNPAIFSVGSALVKDMQATAITELSGKLAIPTFSGSHLESLEYADATIEQIEDSQLRIVSTRGDTLLTRHTPSGAGPGGGAAGQGGGGATAGTNGTSGAGGGAAGTGVGPDGDVPCDVGKQLTGSGSFVVSKSAARNGRYENVKSYYKRGARVRCPDGSSNICHACEYVVEAGNGTLSFYFKNGRPTKDKVYTGSPHPDVFGSTLTPNAAFWDGPPGMIAISVGDSIKITLTDAQYEDSYSYGDYLPIVNGELIAP